MIKSRSPLVAALAAARSVGFSRPSLPTDPAFSATDGAVAEFRALASACRKRCHWRIAAGIDLLVDSIAMTVAALAEPPGTQRRATLMIRRDWLSGAAMRLLSRDV